MAFPEDRPDATIISKTWDEDTQTWYAVGTAIGSERLMQAGGRYTQQIVVVSNQGNIYYGDA